MKIHYVLHGSDKLASYRMRYSNMWEALRELGHEITAANSTYPGDADVTVFSKHFNPMDLAYMQANRINGFGKSLYDITDFHLANPQIAPHYYAAMMLADRVSFSSKALQEDMSEKHDPDAVIPEAISYPTGSRSFENIRPCFFGHQSNFSAELLDVDADIFSNQIAGVGVIPWSTDAVFASNCNASLIPHTPKSHWKSPNRVVDSLAMGMIPIVSARCPAYEEFEPFIVKCHTMKDGLAWAEENLDEVQDKVYSGQLYVLEHYSVERIAKKWDNLFRSMAS